jgi:hypothetical protein
VEWAADEAVHDRLTIRRPAGFDNLGLPAYSPQRDIPAPKLAGGGTIPAQVLLGVLATESNFDQASFHALPGYAGDPLIADYYGAGGGVATIDYAKADCGYGLGQVTTGMTAGSRYWGPPAMQAKIAVDYTENVAATVALLSQKWNQLAGYPTPILANGGQAADVENWYLALWAYNTGLDPNASTGNKTGCTPGPHCTDSAGHWGLGWTNNPVDPDWNPARKPFLKSGYADASHPEDWPYQERVLGWAAVPLRNYQGQRSYRPVTHYPKIAPFDTFCTEADSCQPGGQAPCALTDSHCWWHQPASWADCARAGTCQTGQPAYGARSAQPASADPYPPDCQSSLSRQAVIVDDEHTDDNLVGCKKLNWKPAGSFALTFGRNAAGGQVSRIDTHQIGAGFGGHLYFAHNYRDAAHRVTGTWKARLRPHAYRVLIHLPSTGGTTTSARYLIRTASGKTYARVLSQNRSRNQWVVLGYYRLGASATVTLTNVTGDKKAGASDVAFDAVAFVPVTTVPR